VTNSSVEELCLFSRALERAIRAVPNKPRSDVTTRDLADAISMLAEEGMRDEIELADSGLTEPGHCSFVDSPSERPF
jgi:hypothetical protein